MSSDNDITIQCTMKYKTSDNGHESSARLSWILVDGGTVMPQGCPGSSGHLKCESRDVIA
jgi:hypothetical protein